MTAHMDPAPDRRVKASGRLAISVLWTLGACLACSGPADRNGGTNGDAVDASADEFTLPRAAVRIAQPAAGSVVEGPDVLVVLEVEALSIVPAGVEQAESGHHHLIVDAPLPDLTIPIPAEPGRYIHLGQGQTEYRLEGLDPGEHEIIALVGDHVHVPLNPPVADTVRFVVGQGP